MNFSKFLEKPLVFKILLSFCLFILILSIFSLYRSYHYSTNIAFSIFKIIFSFGLCLGFYKVKKWAWALLLAFVLFTTLGLIHSILSFRNEFNLSSLVSIVISAFVIWALNVKDVRTLFQVDVVKGQQTISGIASFAVFCMTIGLFLLVNMLTRYGFVNIFIPANTFIVFFALVYVLLGIGMLQLNKFAFQSVHPILIFTFLTIIFIMGYDYFKLKRFLALNHSIFYISISIGMLIYWNKLIRPQIQKDFY